MAENKNNFIKKKNCEYRVARMKKEGVIILMSILLFSMLSIVVNAACLENINTGSCLTGTATPSAEFVKRNESKVCVFDENRFSCQDKAEKFSYCCEARSWAGAVVDGFLVTPENVNRARVRMADWENQGNCFPGTLHELGDGRCNPGNPPFVDTRNRGRTITGLSNAKRVCSPGTVVCAVSSSSTLLHTPYLNQFFACCPVQDGITVDYNARTELPFPNIQLGQGPADVKTQINQCDKDSTLCGFSFNQQELDGNINFKETIISGLTCCKLTNVKIKKENPFQIRPSQVCFTNEVMCGAVAVSAKFLGANIAKYFSNPLCCELKKCEERPECAKPDGDANCDGKKDKEEEICKQEGDDDSDGVKNKDDKCPATVSCTLPAGQQCNPAASNCARGLVCNPNTRVCVPRANNAQPGPCNREEEKTIIQDESSEFLGCSRSQVAAKSDEDAVCAQLGFQTVAIEGKNMCCGDDGAEFFVGDGKACLDQQVVSSPGIGGGLGDRAVVFQQEGRLDITTTIKTINGKTLAEDAPIPIRKRNGVPGADNQYTIEFTAYINGRDDPTTKLIIRVFDNRGMEIFLGTYPSFAEYKITHEYRRLSAPLSLGDASSALKIAFEKKGGGGVRVSDLVVYQNAMKKILFNENKFVMCTSPEKGDEEKALKNSLQFTAPAAAPLIAETRTACQQESGFVCDTDGVWRTPSLSAPELVVKNIPSDQQRRELRLDDTLWKIATNAIYQKRTNACCSADQCWTGERCIGGYTFGSSFMSPDGKKALFCRRGVWEVGSFKKNQHENDGRVCPEKFCAYKTAQGHDCRPDGFFGPAVDGEEGEDVFCDAGAWTSRPAKIARALFLLPEVGSRFSIYCDTPEDVLVNKDYAPALPAETSEFMKQGGANYACVLEYNTHAWKDAVFKGLLSEVFVRNQNVIVALALKNADAITNVDTGLLPSLDPAFGATDMVDGVTQLTYCMAPKKYFDDPLIIGFGGGREEFIGCTGVWNAERAAQHRYDQGMIVDRGEANLWYNQRLNTVLYSPKAFRVK